MSKLVIKSSSDFKKFLKILAEESVLAARDDINGRAQQQKVAAGIKHSKSQFMSEEDPAPAPEAGKEPPAESPQKEKPEAPVSAPQSDAEISPKFDSLVDAINTLRGTPSTKDSAVESQLRSYYDKLDSAEAASAILYLRSVADVMSGNVDGARAPDPSDFSITTTMKQEKSKEAAPEPKAAAPTSPIAPPAPAEPAGDEENTTPPIKVGGQQVTEAYRQKIRDLIRR